MTQALLTDPRMTQAIHRTDTDPGIIYGGQCLVLAQVMPTAMIIAYLIFIPWYWLKQNFWPENDQNNTWCLLNSTANTYWPVP